MAGNSNRSWTASAAALDFDELRRAMVEEQMRARGIRDERVLAAMLAVPRHEFLSEQFQPVAYSDQPLPIGEGQTISQPYMVAAMTEAMRLEGHERVLEVGTGSGYQAAVLARLAEEVFSIEKSAVLAQAARERLARLGGANVVVRTGDGSLGLPDAAPFDAIVVTAAAPRVPPPLVEQLVEGGRLIIPVGPSQHQELLEVVRRGGKTFTEVINYCRFVPLVGRHAWSSGPHE